MKIAPSLIRMLVVMMAAPALAGSEINIDDLQQQLTSLHQQLDASKRSAMKLRAELNQLQDDLAKNVGKTTKTDARDAAALAELATVQADFNAYQERYRSYIRGKAAGMEMLDIELRGHKFTSLKVKAVDDTWFIFQHSGGVVRVPMKEISQSIRDLFACVEPKEPTPPPVSAAAAEVEEAVAISAAAAAGQPIIGRGSSAAVAAFATDTAELTAAPGYSPAQDVSFANSNRNVTVTRDHAGNIIVLGPGKTLPPKGKTIDGYDIVNINGRAAVVIGSGSNASRGSSAPTSAAPPGYKPIGSNFSTSKPKEKQ